MLLETALADDELEATELDEAVELLELFTELLDDFLLELDETLLLELDETLLLELFTELLEAELSFDETAELDEA